MVSVSFTHPQYLAFLFILPLIVSFHFYFLKVKRSHALKFANFDAVARIKGIDFYSKNIVLLGITSLIVFLLIFSLSGATLHMELPASSLSFVLAIDSSKSMEAIDFPPSRMQAAKEAASQFVDNAPIGTDIGVVSFSGNALIEQKVTTDKALIRNAIDNINITFIGGTDIYEAVVTSSNLLVGRDNKAIILLSDGQMNIGALDDAIDYAIENDMIIYTIGLGTVEGGNTSYGLSKLDEDSLRSLAFNTGGEYYNALDKDNLANSWTSILDIKLRNVAIPLIAYFLMGAIILMSIQYILFNTKYRVFP